MEHMVVGRNMHHLAYLPVASKRASTKRGFLGLADFYR